MTTVAIYKPDVNLMRVNHINVFVGPKLVCQIGIDHNSVPTINIPHDEILVVQTDPATFREVVDNSIHVVATYTPVFDEDMGLPKFQKEVIAGTVSEPRYNPRNSSDSIEELLRDEVLSEIVDSYIAEPKQSKKRTAQITHEMSERLSAGVMSIAGVRANLTRGAYGMSLQELIDAKLLRHSKLKGNVKQEETK